MPANLVKNIRAVAALVTYDLLTRQNSMKQEDQYRFCYNAFHGNKDRNISSQVDLLLQGHRYYSLLYDIKSKGQVTDRDANVNQNPTPDNNHTEFVIKEHFGGNGSCFVKGKHFNKESLVAPTKARKNEKVTGRNILDLALTVIQNVKKGCAMADEFMDNGQLPSGKSWDDLYQHILSRSGEISKERGPYTGWIALELLTKYNEDGENVISVLTSDGSIGEDESRSTYREKDKAQRGLERNVAVGSKDDGFVERGLSLQNRLHVIKMAQMEDDKVNSITQLAIANADRQLQNLLEERKQSIELAKAICPEFDRLNEYWIAVNDLTSQINKKKESVNELNVERAVTLKKHNHSSILANKLLSSLSTTSDEFASRVISKRQKTNTTPQSSTAVSRLTTPSSATSRHQTTSNTLNNEIDAVANSNHISIDNESTNDVEGDSSASSCNNSNVVS